VNYTKGSSKKADIEEKKAWISAVLYCYKTAGFRPSPPVGDEIGRPEDIIKRAKWNECAAKQSAFIKLCADRVGKLSRPDCADPAFKNICEASKKACQAAVAEKISLPPSFRKCEPGASLYQAEYVCNNMCGSHRQVQSNKNAGASDPEAMADLALCGLLRNSWKRQIQAEDDAFAQAVSAMDGLAQCWLGAQ